MSRKSKSQYQFNVGDRVAERPKPHGIFTQCDETRKRIAQYRSQRITHKGKRYYLGSFATELEAAKAYNKAALAIIGSYAIINQLPEESNG